MNRRLLVAGLIGIAFAAAAYALMAPAPESTSRPNVAVAVELSPAERGSLVTRRRFAGNLEPAAEFQVAPKVGGQILEVLVDIGDSVARGDIVTRLDDAEFQQSVAQARAELAVAEARLQEAVSAANLATRRLDRIERLEARGVASASELDDASGEAQAQQATVAVTRAQRDQAEAALNSAEVRLGYTRVRADWPGEDETRLVGERMVDAGDTVAANTPLLSIVDIDQLRAVIEVPQSLYGGLAVGDPAQILPPGRPDSEALKARISRISPRFDPESRRTRVELIVDNQDRRLAAGMFVQVGLESRRVEDALIVPRAALVNRQGRQGVFTVAPDADSARFVAVEVALESDDRAALRGVESLDGPVVVLGQDQLTDGAAITRAGQAQRS
ncbi:efflux RND transporter periplasmic adaptor subunit [Spectribacter hydrogenoxidans]|uniref:Efflux RND transporter periplasmic adaptor subunit n=1 Tax=Spectribacter hydrogenoxidans TaxID=3075608 RepID=A0ABU3BZ38_9GAMM|nr:efflux RND transporter periplasmic adaptor subunit [Salinisphaera sp. W335]MDT0634575.1 efflux RND transporter periplasmic adaptor subunit [Salinisphaera sp. W335]